MNTRAILAAVAMALATPAAADVITFDNFAVPNNPPFIDGDFSTDGYDFANGQVINVSSSTYLKFYGTANSGHIVMGSGHGSAVVMTRSDGRAFNLKSFYAKYFQGCGCSREQTVVASLNGTQVFSYTYTLDSFVSFAPYQKIVTNFGPADKVTFSVDAPAGALFDSIDVTPVPEPATWAFMTLGLGVLGAAMRRRASTVVG